MNIQIANRLVELRKNNGYSQEVLAEKLGISRQAISKWERAEASPDTDNLISLAEIYGMTLDEILNPAAEAKELKKQKKQLNAAQKIGKKMFMALPIVCMVIIAAYVVCGFILGRYWWSHMWILFLIIPIFATVATACRAGATKRLLWMLMTIPVGLLTVLTYIAAGLFLDAWAVAWIAFLIIPFYCYLSFLLTKKKK